MSTSRFLPLSEVCEILAISAHQGYQLVHTGELEAIQIGPKGSWRVERTRLEEYIEAKYAEQRKAVRSAEAAQTGRAAGR